MGSPAGISRALAGIPVVRNATERDALFPSPEVNQRVDNLGLGRMQRFNGTAWVDTYIGGALATGTPAVTVHDVTVLTLPTVIDFEGRVTGEADASTAVVTIPDLPITNPGGVVVASPLGIKFIGGGVSVSNVGGVAQVTITGSGAVPGVNVEDEGSAVLTPATGMNFVGDGVAATDAGGGVAQITVPGTIGIDDEGTPVVGATVLDFVGNGVVVDTPSSKRARITIAGPISPISPLPDGGHWMADAGIGVANGQPVPLWTDQSAAGINLTDGDAAATAPTFVSNEDGDGLPLVRFDGDHNQLSALGIGPGAAAELTVAIVYRTIAVDGGARRSLMALCPNGGDQSSDSWRANVMAVPGFQVGYKFNSVGAFYNGVAVGASQNNEGMNDGAYEWTIAVLRWKNILGTGVITVRQGLASCSYNLGAVCRVQPYTNFYLGSGSTGGVGGTGYNQQDVREVAIYRSGLPDSSVRTLLRYLGNKWQVPGFL